MNVEKKIQKFKNRFELAKPGETVKVVKLKRKHFKPELSNSVGFGFEDLNPDSRQLFKWLINEEFEFKTTPIGNSPDDFGVLITTTKPV